MNSVKQLADFSKKIYHLLPLRVGGLDFCQQKAVPTGPTLLYTRQQHRRPTPYVLWSWVSFNEDSHPSSHKSPTPGPTVQSNPPPLLLIFSLRRVIPRIDGSHVFRSQKSNQWQESWVSPQLPFSLNADISPSLSLSAGMIGHVSIPHGT